MAIIDSQVHAYEANTPKRPWALRYAAEMPRLPIKGLRVNEWVILGLKARQTGGLRRTFALRLGSEFAMNVGWHEH
jgi:hypothetical protein